MPCLADVTETGSVPDREAKLFPQFRLRISSRPTTSHAPQGAQTHPLRIHLQNLDRQTGSVQAQPNPAHSGTEHLGCLERWVSRLREVKVTHWSWPMLGRWRAARTSNSGSRDPERHSPAPNLAYCDGWAFSSGAFPCRSNHEADHVRVDVSGRTGVRGYGSVSEKGLGLHPDRGLIPCRLTSLSRSGSGLSPRSDTYLSATREIRHAKIPHL